MVAILFKKSCQGLLLASPPATAKQHEIRPYQFKTKGLEPSALGRIAPWIIVCSAVRPQSLVVGIGTVTFGNDGTWGNTDLKDAQRQIDLCLDHGVNLLDTSNAYNDGLSESMIGEALVDGRRERMLVATKVRFSMGKGPNDRGLSRAHIIEQCENSLRRLKTAPLISTRCTSGTVRPRSKRRSKRSTPS